MNNFTTNTYKMKREIVKFSKKICEGASKFQTKFTLDMIYGIFQSKKSSISEALNKKIKKLIL